MYQNVTEVNFMFFEKKSFQSRSNFVYLEPGLYPSITDFVESMNTLIQKRYNHNESCITVKVSRKTQQAVIYLANERSVLAFLSTELARNFGSNIGNAFGVMLREKGLHKPDFAYKLSAYTLS